MPTWRDLWRQRLRWQRGALENIGMYGVTSATARNWAQQLGLGYGVLALWSAMFLSIVSYFDQGLLVVVGFWFVLGLVFVIERTATVWSGGWHCRLTAFVIALELGYSVFLQAVYLHSMLDILFGRDKHWNAALVRPVAP